jgi:hypothetical protein
LVRVSRNILSLDIENKKAAGTAQDTVGHPGTQTPMTAKTRNSEPRLTYRRLLVGLLATQYFSTTSSIAPNRSM